MEILRELLIAVITVCTPILTGYIVSVAKNVAENMAAKTGSTVEQSFIQEITDTISTAVSSTNQTYVDALKSAGQFSLAAQKEALQKSLDTALSILSTAAQEFITETYGDLEQYLTARIEAEVRTQKFSTGVELTSVLESADTTTVAASTAAATAATIAQTAINQLSAEVSATAETGAADEAAQSE